MSITVELPPDVEDQLQAEAKKRGLTPPEYVRALLEDRFKPKDATSGRPSPIRLMAMSPEERGRILEAAAEDAAELYRADLARPVTERELTAFTALDGEPFHEYDDLDGTPEARRDLAS